MAAPLFASANYSIDNSVFTCSAGLSFANSNGLDAHCAGNFSVTGGTWTSDTKIALSADGSLTLDGVTMTAPIIELLSPQVVVNAFLNATGGSVRIDAPRSQPPRSPTLPEVILIADADTPRSQYPRSPSEPSNATPGGNSGSLDVSAGADISVTGSFSDNSVDGSRPQGGSIEIREGAQLVVSGSISTDSSQTPLIWAATVPEPETCTLALAALAILGSSAAVARRRKA